jgi:hypothetical protein
MVRGIGLVIVMGALLAGVCGCGKQSRRFDMASFDWFGLKKGGTVGVAQSQPTRPATGNPFVESYRVWIFRSTGTDACREQGWSYLDELLPGAVQDAKVLASNGLRCGVGRVSDWPKVKEQLEACQTITSRENSPMDIAVARMSSIVLLSDEMKRDRTLFYYDRNGRLRGCDGASKLQLVLISGGRIAEGRRRVVFSPRILEPTNRIKAMTDAARPASATPTVEKELENLSFTVDLGPEEFVLLGPRNGELAASLIGAQLFTKWDQGQRGVYLILVKPVGPEEMPAPAEGKGRGKPAR